MFLCGWDRDALARVVDVQMRELCQAVCNCLRITGACSSVPGSRQMNVLCEFC